MKGGRNMEAIKSEGVPAQILIAFRADGPHSRLLEFFAEQMGPGHLWEKTCMYIVDYMKGITL